MTTQRVLEFLLQGRDESASKSLNAVGSAAEKTSGQLSQAGISGEQAAARVESASRRLEAAKEREAVAQRKVVIEEAKLEELRSAGVAKASQVLAQEDKLAAARTAATKATTAVRGATESLDRAQDALAASSDRAAVDLRKVGTSAETTKVELSGLGAGMAVALGGLATGALVSFGKSAVDSFAQVQDATAAAGVVFGDSMGKIIAQASEAAATLGMSKSQVIDAANVFGVYGKSAGLAGDELASFSTEMTTLAGGMASFRGTSPEQAIEAIGAALRGEKEPIRAYGVMLDDASIKQQALKMGLIETTKGALEPQQKVLAVQALILKQTSDMQGDFARTSDSLANKQKTLAAAAENAKASIGEHLAPAMLTATNMALGLVSAFEANSAVVTPLATGLMAVVGAAVLVVGSLKALEGIQAVTAGFTTARGAVEGFAVQMKLLSMEQTGASAMGLSALSKAAVGLGAALPVLGVAAGLAAVEIVAIGAKSEQTRLQVESLTAAIKADSGALGENTRSAMANIIQQQGGYEAAKRLGISLADLTDAALGNAAALARVTAATQAAIGPDDQMRTSADANATAGSKLNLMLGEQKGVLASAREGFENVAAGTADASTAASNAIDPNSSLGKAIAKVATSAKDAADNLKKQTDEMWASADAALQLSGSEIGYQAAIDDATKSLKEHGKTLDVDTDAGRANQGTLDKIASSALAVIKGQVGMGKSTSELWPQVQTMRDSFIKSAEAMGATSTEAAALADKYGLIPKNVETAVNQHGAEDAAAKASAFKAELDKIPAEQAAKIMSVFNKDGIDAAQAALDSVHDKTITVTTKFQSIGTPYVIPTSTTSVVFGSANGNIFKAYGNGGVENHVAQIAPGGAWRIWAEDETEGESYIPLARSKRARSLDIWAETGRLLGVQGLASGAVSGGSVGGSEAALAETIAAALAKHLPRMDVRLVGAVDRVADVIGAEIMLGYRGGV